jgi:dTDP-4-dehydrorhamnose reductase
LRNAQEHESLRVVFDQIGSPTYAADLAKVLAYNILPNAREGFGEIFHYSNEGVASRYDFARAVVRKTGREICAIEPIETRDLAPTPLAARPAFSVLNKRKIKEVFGLSVPHWQSSLAVCVKRLKRFGTSV